MLRYTGILVWAYRYTVPRAAYHSIPIYRYIVTPLLACQIFSVQLCLACVLEQSSLCCAYRLILLERSTTSISWSPSFERRESELTSSFALTLYIQQIIARSLRRRGLSVATVMAHVSAACSITFLTQVEYTRPLVKKVADCGW